MSSERPPLIGAIVHIELDPLLLSDPRSAEHVHALLKIRAEQDAELASQDAGATCAHCGASIEQQAARILRRVSEEIEREQAAEAAAERADRPTPSQPPTRD